MITQAELQQLIDFEPGDSPVLSLYLNVDPSRRSKDKYTLWLRSLLKKVSGQADPADVERVQRYFELEYGWQGKSIVCFACTKADLWQVFPLAVPIEDGVFVGDRPHIKPLTDLMDRHEPYGIALVDREGARLFRIHLGEIVETAGTLGEETALSPARRAGRSRGGTTFPYPNGSDRGHRGYAGRGDQAPQARGLGRSEAPTL